ncbi:MAG: GNAT family N-acetyltransferase [Sphingobacteriales bacterium]
MEIKVFTQPYQQQIIDLILNIQNNEFGIPVTIEQQKDLLIIPSFYQQQKENFWIALDEDKVVGTIALIDIGNKQTALRKMFVHKDYRGKEKAVAALLLQKVNDWCKEKDINEIYLGTVEVLKAAQRFYEKNDYVRIEKKELPVKFPVMEVDTVFYKYSF